MVLWVDDEVQWSQTSRQWTSRFLYIERYTHCINHRHLIRYLYIANPTEISAQLIPKLHIFFIQLCDAAFCNNLQISVPLVHHTTAHFFPRNAVQHFQIFNILTSIILFIRRQWLKTMVLCTSLKLRWPGFLHTCYISIFFISPSDSEADKDSVL